MSACPFISFQAINYDTLRGGISIETRKGDHTISHLLIQNADETNSGKYSCSPSNAIVASIRVHVLNGKFFRGDNGQISLFYANLNLEEDVLKLREFLAGNLVKLSGIEEKL